MVIKKKAAQRPLFSRMQDWIFVKYFQLTLFTTAEITMTHSSSKNAGFAGLRLGLSPGIWLLAAFICIGPFIAQAWVVAIAGNVGSSIAAAGLHFVLSINAGIVAYTGTHKSFSDIPAGSLISLTLAAFTYNALAVILARSLIALW